MGMLADGDAGGVGVELLKREAHPVADVFPMMQGREFEDFKADIAAHAQREEILLDAQGRIIDGRNRDRACRDLGIEPRYRVWDGDGSDSVAVVRLVMSANYYRRHLNESQRAMVAARLRRDVLEPAAIREQAGGPSPAALPPIAWLSSRKSFAIAVLDLRSAQLEEHVAQAEFPDYRPKLSKEHSLKITVDRAALLEALTCLERTVVFEKGVYQARAWFEGDRLMFRVEGTNDAEDAVEAQAEGEPLPAFKFNVERLQKIVGGMGEVETVTLAFNPGPRSPLEVFCREEPGYRALTMPMMNQTVSP
jgi:hypothetical protein